MPVIGVAALPRHGAKGDTVYTMLVAVDGSEHSENAVRYALDMVRRIDGARVLLVNVQPPAMSGEVSNLLTAEEVLEQHTAAGKAVLAAAEAILGQSGSAYETEILIGRPAESIVEAAQRRGCDAIVIGASSHGPLHTLVLGSVASKVVHSAEVPVTVVK